MLINAKNLDNSKVAINTHKVVRFRDAHVPDEPVGSITLDLQGKRIFLSDELEDLSERIHEHYPLARLTTPIRTAIFVAADRVVDLHKPSSISHHRDAKAVIALYTDNSNVVHQQVLETVAKSRDIINNSSN